MYFFVFLLIWAPFGLTHGQDVQYPQMYEISTRPWLYSLSQKYSRPITKLTDIPMQEFQNLASQGYNIIWLMGIWHLGDYGLHYDQTNPGLLKYYPTVLPGYTQADIIGSPYAVTNYTCNPTIGSDSDIAALRAKLNRLGLKLMLDFVPNHSAVDSTWSANVQYYIREAPGVPHDPNRFQSNGVAYGWGGWGDSWQDTSQFNYWNLDFRAMITNSVLKIASVSDYIRCDMAHLLINDVIQSTWGTQLSAWKIPRPSSEAWSYIISTTKKQFPNVKFLAEVYSPNQKTLQNLGFDFTYDKDLYDHLGNGNLDNLRGYINGVGLAYHQKSAHFVENHDEPRAATFFGGNLRADAAAMVTMTLPGMRFYFEGQSEGLFNRLDIHLRRGKAESVNSGVQSFYSKFVSILKADVFHKGQWQYMGVGGAGDSWRLMAWQWKLNNIKVLCVINYSDQKGSGKIVLPDANPVGGNDTIPVTELISGVVYERSAQDLRTNGLWAIVDYWSIQMFQFD